MKTAAASVLVLILAFFAWAGLTEDFQVYTKEQARRLHVSQTQPWLPDTLLLDERRTEHALQGWAVQGRKLLIIEFIYTRCNAVCRNLGSEFQQLQQMIKARNLQGRVALLSISFDPAHDTPEVLARHAARLKADAEIWRFATVRHQSQLAALLQFFAITVIPDEFGGYQHNAALLAVSPHGRLFSIADYGSDQPQAILDAWLKISFPAGT